MNGGASLLEYMHAVLVRPVTKKPCVSTVMATTHLG